MCRTGLLPASLDLQGCELFGLQTKDMAAAGFAPPGHADGHLFLPGLAELAESSWATWGAAPVLPNLVESSVLSPGFPIKHFAGGLPYTPGQLLRVAADAGPMPKIKRATDVPVVKTPLLLSVALEAATPEKTSKQKLEVPRLPQKIMETDTRSECSTELADSPMVLASSVKSSGNTPSAAQVAQSPTSVALESGDRSKLGSAELPSIGSAGHKKGRCKPCAFVHTEGCGNGANCAFCHLCLPGEKKRRKKEIRALRKVRGGAESDAAGQSEEEE